MANLFTTNKKIPLYYSGMWNDGYEWWEIEIAKTKMRDIQEGWIPDKPSNFIFIGRRDQECLKAEKSVEEKMK